MDNGNGESADLVAFDIGNTSVKCAVRTGGRWRILARVTTRPVENLADRLAASLAEQDMAGCRSARCVACSVHPPADGPVAAAWGRAPDASRVERFRRDIPVPIAVRPEPPEQVGTDRLLLALGGRKLYGAPCVVISAGTAITVDVVDGDGAFAGGAIGPGFDLAGRALHERTAQLPLVSPDRPAAAIGHSTREAVANGVYWFCAGGVRALVERYEAALGASRLPIVCTGGDAALLLPSLEERRPRHEPELIFVGMETALDAP